MKFIVREEHKDGGAVFPTADEAISAAVMWRIATEVRCEIFIEFARHPLDGQHSIAHTIAADLQYEALMDGWDDMRKAYPDNDAR